ncbi:EscU/YscU/HrcU family type III secretion system export apparatus switch protein [Serratia marcescens]|uniref:EscU/YscU/HrcU family type III secretion system export apparatus switch protein n=1 Tax=Serratia marcescens TaxID=615 RepID=UPI00148B3F6D|nr:EscU/YscU/HrcU family type III secretion system export apparatus switch protein [Serratia marcescens]QJU42316.1 EscU/YscU/HrcU family type III secretion system export apparatus switch protein [Serratia marcescens]
MSSSKTEKPTQKKLKDAAQKGQSFKSKDLVVTCLLLIGMEYIINLISLKEIADVLVAVIDNDFKNNVHEYSFSVIFTGCKILLPILWLCIFLSVLPTLLQTKFIIAAKSLKLNFGAINPTQGIKKIFSLRALKDAIKSCLYLGCFVVAGILFWRENRQLIFSQVYGSLQQLIEVWGRLFHSLLVLCLSCIIFVVALDLLAEFFLHIKDNKMDKQEVKKEYKEQEGNPEVKAQRKQLHHELLSEQMKSDIKSSKAIITNPTHIAVGLYLNPDVLPLPFISVLETNHRAQAVKAYAKKVGVPVIENIKLARLIKKTHKRYSFVNIEAIEEVMKLLNWLEQVENAWKDEFENDIPSQQ